MTTDEVERRRTSFTLWDIYNSEVEIRRAIQLHRNMLIIRNLAKLNGISQRNLAFRKDIIFGHKGYTSNLTQIVHDLPIDCSKLVTKAVILGYKKSSRNSIIYRDK